MGWILDVKAEGGAETAAAGYRGLVGSRAAGGRGVRLLVSDGCMRRWVQMPQARFNLYFKPRLGGVAAQLLEHPAVDCEVNSDFVEEWFSPPWYTSTMQVARLPFTSLPSLLEVERRIVGEGVGEAYNAFPDRLTQLFWVLGYPPTALVEAEDSAVRLAEDNPLAEDYAEPRYSWADLRLYDWYGEAFYPLTGRRPTHFALHAKIGEEELRVEREEASKLESYIHILHGADVVRRPKAYDWFLRGAGLDPSVIPLTLDKTSPTDEGIQEEVTRLVEWSRISSTPLRLLAHSSIGKPLTANEAHVAFKRRWLIAGRPPRVERSRPLGELLKHDRGGLIFRPKPGLYFNVAQLDFTSMYPSLIAKWNISPETVDTPHATNPIAVPETSHYIQPRSERVGLVPEALGWLLERRERLRKLARERGNAAFKIRQQAVKWLLVASFGYLGFRNAKFGRIEAYECVTALARWTAEQAINAVKKRGYRVLHVLVDSLFVQRLDGAPFEQGEVERLIDEVGEAAGLALKLEALYDWVVFSKNAHSDVGEGSPQRYFGLLNGGGGLKVKGLECVKRSTPGLVRRAQLEALDALREARTPDEFWAALRRAEAVFKAYRLALLEGDPSEFDPASFAFCVRSGRRASVGGRHVRMDGCVWLMRTRRGLSPAEVQSFSVRDVDIQHYLKLLGSAWTQIDPRGEI